MIRRYLLAAPVLTIFTAVVAVWLAPRHPQSIHANRNRKGWDR